VSAFSTYLLPYANIVWQSADMPYTSEYEDVYWSRAGGLDEKRCVFLSACQLKPRWAALNKNESFCIAELGFGFGLNFLLTLREWRKRKPKGRLDYISFEKHLVPETELVKAAEAFGLSSELKALLENYPQPIPGPHQIRIDDSCTLTVVVGDAKDHLPNMRAELDAVFLDGFSPSKNPALWQTQLVGQLTKQMRPGGLASTYSVAGELRRTLQAAGLTVEKVPGYGNKRHRLIAQVPGDWQPKMFAQQNVTVLGAGLTGLFCASALQARGHNVTLVDRQGLHGAVRDIQQIAIYPQLSQTPQPYSNLYLRAFHFYLAHRNLHASGRLELLETDSKVKKGIELSKQLAPIVEFKQPDECSALLGFDVQAPGLLVPRAGWLDPATVEAACDLKVETVHSFKQRSDRWRLELEGTSLDTDTLVLASGPTSFPVLTPFNLMPLRGQSLRLEAPGLSPKCILSSTKTWFPANQNGLSTVSGTYSRFDRDTQTRSDDETELLSAVTDYIESPQFSSQVGIRSATRDRLPIVGKVPNWQALDAHLSSGVVSPFTDYEPNLYACLGFGSHGGTLGPYSAELITRMVSGDALVEPMGQIDPLRFALRDGEVDL
jgi:tRNA 5-methylaminomethyl-2-thiouridine biosynthesis bifunctional protein